MLTVSTIVSGYWIVKGKHSHSKFATWLQNTLRVNCPYVFFGNKESLEIVKTIRGELPTHYITIELEDFYTTKYKQYLMPHEIHVPSSEVCMIWLEKLFLLKTAKDLNPFNSEYFLWVDAGICSLRNITPTLNPLDDIKIRQLPKDKFVFTSSEEPYEPYKVHNNNYYHYVSGTAFLLHKSFIDTFVHHYKLCLDENITYINWVNTEQKILTHMYQKDPTMFLKLGQGYGELLTLLY